MNTVRITGVTAAANYVSLITPQLRGSRADGLRTSTASTPGATTTATQSTSSSASAGSDASVSSSAPGASSAFQSATKRFGSTLRGSSSGSGASASANTPAQSASMGPTGIGTAADSLPGGGGNGTGPGGFMLVLQHVVKPGSHVKKGDVIAEFDRQYMMLRLDDYRASVAQADSSFTKQKAELDITRNAHEQLIASAKADLDKAKLDLKTVPVLSVIDAERAKLAMDQADAKYKQLLAEVKFVLASQEADLRNAELSLQQAKLELKRAEVNTDRMSVAAPIDGLAVMQSMFRGGDFGQIQQGDQLWPGMFFMQVVNPSSMVINSTVNQVDVDKFRVGTKAKIHFDAYPGLELPAHVESIAAVTKPGGFRASFVREVPVRLKLDAMDPRVIPDLSVSADVVLEAEASKTAIVPAASVWSEGSLGKTYVLVQQSSGWERRPVGLGVQNAVSAAVKSGLRQGEVVALDRPSNLAETP